jgi:sialidase-1
VVDRSTGTIWLLMSHNLGKDDELPLCRRTAEGTRTAWVANSEDDGLTWSKPREITAAAKKPEWGYFATGPGVGIQLQQPPHRGRLVIPCNYTVQPDMKHPEQFKWGSHAILSDDHGATWRLGGVVPGFDVDECQVVELADGDLLINMRSHVHGCRAAALSKDGGESWGEPWYDKTLIDSDCQGSILCYRNAEAGGRDRIVFSNAANAKSRDHMTVRLSGDEGKSWPAARLLYGGPAAYSCLTTLPDGMVGCLYELGRKHPYEGMTFVRFSLKWLAEGTEQPK